MSHPLLFPMDLIFDIHNSQVILILVDVNYKTGGFTLLYYIFEQNILVLGSWLY